MDKSGSKEKETIKKIIEDLYKEELISTIIIFNSY